MKRKGTSNFNQVFHNGRRLRGLWSPNGNLCAQIATETSGVMRVTKLLLEAHTAPTDSKSKNRRPRDISFNPELETLLAEMKAKHPEDSSYLFPSPQRGDKDKPATTLWDSFKLVRKHVKMEYLGFHDFRHLFISKCVMAGVD